MLHVKQIKYPPRWVDILFVKNRTSVLVPLTIQLLNAHTTKPDPTHYCFVEH